MQKSNTIFYGKPHKNGIIHFEQLEKVSAMGICHNKLWKLPIDRHMAKTQLRFAVGLSTVTFARMNKGQKIRVGTLNRICEFMGCKTDGIMEVADA